MQVQIKIIRVYEDDPSTEEELNKFLRGNRILKLTEQYVVGLGCWSFCVHYLDGLASTAQTKKRGKRMENRAERIDYKKVLNEGAFACFEKLRYRRKELSREEGIPAYAIFTDAELAAIAQQESPSLKSLKGISGVGVKKIERYGDAMLACLQELES